MASFIIITLLSAIALYVREIRHHLEVTGIGKKKTRIVSVLWITVLIILLALGIL